MKTFISFAGLLTGLFFVSCSPNSKETQSGKGTYQADKLENHGRRLRLIEDGQARIEQRLRDEQLLLEQIQKQLLKLQSHQHARPAPEPPPVTRSRIASSQLPPRVPKTPPAKQPKPSPKAAPQAVPSPQPESSAKYYTVRRGDSLSRVATAHGISLSELLRANSGIRPNHLEIGQRLAIPAKGGESASSPGLPDPKQPGLLKIYHLIQSGDTLSSIARRYGASVQSLQSYNPGLNPDRLIIGSRILVRKKTPRLRAGR